MLFGLIICLGSYDLNTGKIILLHKHTRQKAVKLIRPAMCYKIMDAVGVLHNMWISDNVPLPEDEEEVVDNPEDLQLEVALFEFSKDIVSYSLS